MCQRDEQAKSVRQRENLNLVLIASSRDTQCLLTPYIQHVLSGWVQVPVQYNTEYSPG